MQTILDPSTCLPRAHHLGALKRLTSTLVLAAQLEAVPEVGQVLPSHRSGLGRGEASSAWVPLPPAWGLGALSSRSKALEGSPHEVRGEGPALGACCLLGVLQTSPGDRAQMSPPALGPHRCLSGLSWQGLCLTGKSSALSTFEFIARV